MKTLRMFLAPLSPFRASSGRFNRYYGGILRAGAGYPTADEARSDMRRRDRTGTEFIGWLR